MDSKLINPANKRKFKIIVVGSGLAGGSAAATLSELGYKVDCFATKIALAELTPLQPKVVSTQPRIIKMMATQFTGFFMIQSKVATSDLAKQTFTG
jgi:thioredoxin reductase